MRVYHLLVAAVVAGTLLAGPAKAASPTPPPLPGATLPAAQESPPPGAPPSPGLPSPVPLPSASVPPVPRLSPHPSTAPAAPVPPASPAPAQSAGVSPLGAFGLPGAPQAYSSFVSGAVRSPGLVDLLRKDDEVYFDLGEDQLHRTLVIAPSLTTGVGNGTVAGRMFEPLLVRFERVGKRILWISENTHFGAPPDSPAAAALKVSVADSIIASSPVVAEDKEKKRVVIAASLFLTDFESVGAELGKSSSPSLGGLFSLVARPSFAVDAARSYFLTTKAFPKNDELSVNLTFAGPVTANIATVPDPRGIPIKMHYSIFELPSDTPMVPRFADDRVGYFIAAQKRYGDDSRATPFLRYIERWNLARGPVTYYLTDEIPLEYRPTVRRALLQWNDAFTRIGIPHAIEVKDQPHDGQWDADDIRYSTVRWITGDRPDMVAFGQSSADPLTGEIFRSTIVIDGEFMRAIKRGYVDTVAPTRGSNAYAASPSAAALCSDEDCGLGRFGASQIALSALALSFEGRLSAAETEAFAKSYLTMVVMHEAGHTLGLRHNFAGEGVYTPAQLSDKRFTEAHGISGSIMGYMPTNLAEHGKPQATYFQNRLGPYDYWAIQYGYMRIPGAATPSGESEALSRIAARSTEHDLAYATDEDAYQPFAPDPRSAPYYLSSDPLWYDRKQFAIVDRLVAGLDRRFARENGSYSEERQAFLTAMNSYEYASMLAARYVGGVYVSRAHRSQPGAPPPFVSIPRGEQRRAFTLLAEHVLSSKAFVFSPALLNDLVPSRFSHWNSGQVFRRTDFPLTTLVSVLQDGVMGQLFSPVNIARINDQDQKSPRGATMSLADLFNWTQAAVWDDVRAPVTGPGASNHRELQRRYTNLMIAIANLPSSAVDQLDIPYETQALARYQLAHIVPQIDRTLARGGLDTARRAHLEDIRSRISHALEPQTVRPI